MDNIKNFVYNNEKKIIFFLLLIFFIVTLILYLNEYYKYKEVDFFEFKDGKMFYKIGNEQYNIDKRPLKIPTKIYYLKTDPNIYSIQIIPIKNTIIILLIVSSLLLFLYSLSYYL